MRVDDRNAVDNVSIGHAGRSQESQRSDQVSLSRTSGSANCGASDQIRLSSLTDRISQGLEDLSSAETARASKLQQEYRSGNYVVDSDALSQALINSMFGTSA